MISIGKKHPGESEDETFYVLLWKGKQRVGSYWPHYNEAYAEMQLPDSSIINPEYISDSDIEDAVAKRFGEKVRPVFVNRWGLDYT